MQKRTQITQTAVTRSVIALPPGSLCSGRAALRNWRKMALRMVTIVINPPLTRIEGRQGSVSGRLRGYWKTVSSAGAEVASAGTDWPDPWRPAISRRSAQRNSGGP
jgi:hypothetical protein